MSRTDLPPVPPASRGKNNEGQPPNQPVDALEKGATSTTRNLSSQGRQGNLRQNTTNKGLQQDR